MEADVKEYKIQKYRKRLDELANANGGELTAEIIVQDAAKRSSPLRDWFEWNNEKAAHEYRLEQARALIRTYRIVLTDTEEPDRTIRVRGFEHAGGSYRRIDDIVKNESWSSELLHRIAQEISTMRARYRAIGSLRANYEAIDAALADAQVKAEEAAKEKVA